MMIVEQYPKDPYDVNFSTQVLISKMNIIMNSLFSNLSQITQACLKNRTT